MNALIRCAATDYSGRSACTQPAVAVILDLTPPDGSEVTFTVVGHAYCADHITEEVHETRQSAHPSEFLVVNLNQPERSESEPERDYLSRLKAIGRAHEPAQPKATTWCPTCGVAVDIGGPLEDAHFVFAVRQDGSRSNLGTCPVGQFSRAVERARTWSADMGGRGYYYQGEVHP